MSSLGFEALPASRKQIRAVAHKLRSILLLEDTQYVNVEELLDLQLPVAFPGFVCDIAEKSELGDNHGYAMPDRKFMRIREDVYIGACEGSGRDRFTILHEIAHLVLHTKDRVVLCRTSSKPVTYCDPEWQANCFAGEFLVSANLVKQFRTIDEISQAFGVSMQAAETQYRALKKEGIL